MKKVILMCVAVCAMLLTACKDNKTYRFQIVVGTNCSVMAAGDIVSHYVEGYCQTFNVANFIANKQPVYISESDAKAKYAEWKKGVKDALVTKDTATIAVSVGVYFGTHGSPIPSDPELIDYAKDVLDTYQAASADDMELNGILQNFDKDIYVIDEKFKLK